jgi:hypothetical protein
VSRRGREKEGAAGNKQGMQWSSPRLPSPRVQLDPSPPLHLFPALGPPASRPLRRSRREGGGSRRTKERGGGARAGEGSRHRRLKVARRRRRRPSRAAVVSRPSRCHRRPSRAARRRGSSSDAPGMWRSGLVGSMEATTSGGRAA